VLGHLTRTADLGKYGVKRLLLSSAVIFGLLLIIFTISRVLIPDPARAWAGKGASQVSVDAIRVQFHLNDPLYLQFFYYLSDLFHGNLGIDPITGLPVTYEIGVFFPATFELTMTAFIMTLLVGAVLGVSAAVHRNKLGDHAARVISLSGVATPPFLGAMVLQLVFFYYLGLVADSGGEISALIHQPAHITGMLVVDCLITGNWPALMSALQHLILPSVALAFLTIGAMSRLVRASMLEALSSDYIRTVRAKGVARTLVIYKHALKNALAQPLTAMGVYLAFLLGGSVVVENIFSWPGIGRFTAQAALSFNLPAVMGVTIVDALVVIIANLLADICVAILDPRIVLK